MIIPSGQGITPKQLEENSVIRRAETHKINSTFKIPTFFQKATDGAYVEWYPTHSIYVYIDGAGVYSAPTDPDSNNTIENAISHVPQLIKTFRTKLISTEIENTDKLIIKSFSFTSTPHLSYSYYDGEQGAYWMLSISFPHRSIFSYSKKFDDILNCTLPDNLTIEKDGIYLTEQYVCTKQYNSGDPANGKTIIRLTSSDEITAIKNGTFEMPVTCNFEISFIEFK